MDKNGKVKRRRFLKTAAAGAALGTVVNVAVAAPKIKHIPVKRDFMRIGMVGLGPYSHAMAYTGAINDPTVPPRTNMKVVAVWCRPDWYAGSLRGTEEWKKSRVDGLKGYLSIEKFTTTLGVETVVQRPEDMLKLVDGVFITDPEDALNLARPFLETGMPVFVNRPIAWSIKEAREIVRLAKQSGSVLVTGSCVPWMAEFMTARSRIDPAAVQHYYIDGSTANFGSYFPHILETALMLTGGRVIRCSTHGMTWPKDEDPLVIPPVFVHLEHEPVNDRDPVMGVASTWFGQPWRNWAKIHLDNDVVEDGVRWEGAGAQNTNEHLWLPFLRVIDQAFQTGVWPQDEAVVLNKVETMLMAHKSGCEGGRPVGISEIEDHVLPRFETEKA
jgi:predicted dehydrogenase